MAYAPPDWPGQVRATLRGHGWSEAEIEEVIEAARVRCATTGKGPRHEFGDGDSYGRRLVRERTGAVATPGRGRRDVVGVLSGLIGIFATALAASGAGDGGLVRVNLGTALAALVVLAFVAAVLLLGKPVMAWLTRGGSMPVLLVGLGSVVLLTVVYLVSPDRTVTIAWPTAASVAVVALTVSVVAAWQHAPGAEGVADASPTPSIVQWLLVFAHPIAALCLLTGFLLVG